MIEALLSPHDAFNFIWNRFGNTKGKADSNLALDLVMEHRIRLAKEFLGRLGANFSPEIAQAYTRALDALIALVEDTEETVRPNSELKEFDDKRYSSDHS